MNLAWFWQPDETWLNTVNTTSLRTVTGVRLAVVVVALGVLAFVWAMTHAIPWTLDPCPVMPCLEPLGRARATTFALGILDSLLTFIAVLLGIAVGGQIGKRLTDTEHQERVALAKQGIVSPDAPVTKEHPAPPVARRPTRAMQAVPEDLPTAEMTPDLHAWAAGEADEGLL